MPQAIRVGIYMLKNRVASQIWQERADKLTRQGVSQQCRAIKIFISMSGRNLIPSHISTEHPTGRSTLNLVP